MGEATFKQTKKMSFIRKREVLREKTRGDADPGKIRCRKHFKEAKFGRKLMKVRRNKEHVRMEITL